MGKASNDPWRRWRLATSDAWGRWLGPAVLVTREREGKGPVQVGGAGARALAFITHSGPYPSVLCTPTTTACRVELNLVFSLGWAGRVPRARPENNELQGSG